MITKHKLEMLVAGVRQPVNVLVMDPEEFEGLIKQCGSSFTASRAHNRAVWETAVRAARTTKLTRGTITQKLFDQYGITDTDHMVAVARGDVDRYVIFWPELTQPEVLQ